MNWRRSFNLGGKGGLAVSLAVALMAGGSSGAAAERPPNFLFIYTDDQRYDAVGVVQREQGDRGRFPWLQTPHMDRLAAEGMRFRNAFVTLPLCAPSRAAFLTGRYNHLNGVANNRTPFPEDSVTYATLLHRAGYAAGYVGKWHMDGQRGKRPGFDYSASFIGQGRYMDCSFEIDGEARPTQGWVDDVSTDFAIDFIKSHREKPFVLVVGFKACHGPFTPPERAKNRFADAQARSVPNLSVRAVYRTAGAAGGEEARKTQADTAPRLNLDYFRCISTADDNLGRLLAVLDEAGLTQDTMVVYTSDNGYYLGEHGLGDKRSAYEESLRIPLLVRYPKLIAKGAVSDELVLNIDVAPTFLELAGVPVPAEMQGRSWVPLLAGKKTEWRQAFLAEYFRERAFPATPTVVAVRTRDAKLIKYPGQQQWTELFDLARDPYETRNLVNDPGSKELLARMEAEFERQAVAVAYRVPPYADELAAAESATATPKAAKGKRKKAAKE